jgi:hypothetical protein
MLKWREPVRPSGTGQFRQTLPIGPQANGHRPQTNGHTTAAMNNLGETWAPRDQADVTFAMPHLWIHGEGIHGGLYTSLQRHIHIPAKVVGTLAEPRTSSIQLIRTSETLNSGETAALTSEARRWATRWQGTIAPHDGNVALLYGFQ